MNGLLDAMKQALEFAKLASEEYPVMGMRTAEVLRAAITETEKAQPVAPQSPQCDKLLDILLRAKDAIEALDGTTVENEKLVDDYRAIFAK